MLATRASTCFLHVRARYLFVRARLLFKNVRPGQLKIRQVQSKIPKIFLLYLESQVHICGAWYFDVGGVKFLKPMMLLMTVMLDDKHDTFDNL